MVYNINKDSNFVHISSKLRGVENQLDYVMVNELAASVGLNVDMQRTWAAVNTDPDTPSTQTSTRQSSRPASRPASQESTPAARARPDQRQAPSTPPNRQRGSSTGQASGQPSGGRIAPPSARELTRRGISNMTLTTPTPTRTAATPRSSSSQRPGDTGNEPTAGPSNSGLTRTTSRGQIPATIPEEAAVQERPTPGGPADRGRRQTRRSTRSERHAASNPEPAQAAHTEEPAQDNPTDPDVDLTKSEYPQVGILTKSKHYKQPPIPTYTYDLSSTGQDLVSDIDGSYLGMTRGQRAQALDQGGRLSYARVGDTREDALTRPIPTAPADWRGWNDMRLRMTALQDAWRQNLPVYRGRQERAARRAGMVAGNEPEEIEEDIYGVSD